MPILPAILAWSKDRPLWQQDALRRLAAQALTDTDILQLVELCRAEYGCGNGGAQAKAVPLGDEPEKSSTAVSQPVVLTGVFDLRNINALEPDQALRIAGTGLTVVYGDNGSGKSGYVRVIKQLCRARGGIETVYPNVYADDPTPASGTLDYSVGSEQRQAHWTPGCMKPVELKEISIFDARSAAIYVSDENEVAYLPSGMDLLPKLANVCDGVRERLERQLADLQRERDRFETIPAGTVVFQQLQDLGGAGARKAVDQWTAMARSEVQSLEDLRRRSAKFKSADPAGEARLRRGCVARLAALGARLSAAEAALGGTGIEDFRKAEETLAAARQAAEMVTRATLTDALIEGTGSGPWKILWQAAREFAEHGTRTPVNFPPSEGNLCLLCQQPIGQSASTRLEAFDAFIKNEAETAVQTATSLLNEQRARLRAVRPASVAEKTLIEEVDGLDKEVADALVTGLRALDRRYEVFATNGPVDWAKIPALPAGSGDALAALRDRVEKEAAEFELASDPAGQIQVENQLREAEARAELARIVDRVYAQIEREKLAAKLNKAIRSASTSAITRLSTGLLDEAVTLPLSKQFVQERESLRLTHIPIALQPIGGRKARARHSVQLSEKTKTQVPPREVLSDGEHRCIALAAFFAEVALQDSNSTLVFDDPVSSLDQSRREYVAKRIVEMSKTRPVLIFTHDLVFLSMLQSAAERNSVPLEPRLFRRHASGAGVIAEEWPWFGQKVSQRLGVLEVQLARLRKLFATEPDEYERDVKSFYGQLRETWEKAVEEILLQGAIQRFDVAVKTQSLANLHKVGPDIYKRLDEGMKRSSSWIQGHDHAVALGASVPPPEDAKADLDELRAWAKEVKRLVA